MKRVLVALLSACIVLAGCGTTTEDQAPSRVEVDEESSQMADEPEKQLLPYELISFYGGVFTVQHRETGEHHYLDMYGVEVGFQEDDEVQWAEVVVVDNKSGILFNDGTYLVEPVYDWIGDYSEGFWPFQQDGLWGYLDEEGNEAIPASYLSAWTFSEGLAAVAVEYAGEGDPDREMNVGYIDASGQMVIQPRMMSTFGIGSFYNGVACISVGDFPNYQDVYIDTAGREIFSCERGAEFSDGVAVVNILHDWNSADPDEVNYLYETAVIDTQGNFLYRQDYPCMGQGADTRADAWMSNGWIAVADFSQMELDPNGDFYNFTGYASVLTEDGLLFDRSQPVDIPWAPVDYVNAQGERLGVRNLAFNYNAFNNGYVYYEGEDGAYGYLDTQGNLAIDLAAVSAELGKPIKRLSEHIFSRTMSGYAVIMTDDGFGLIDSAGQVVLPPIYGGIEGAYSYGEDMVIHLSGGDFIGLDGAVRFSI